jgi:hypothetical protein
MQKLSGMQANVSMTFVSCHSRRTVSGALSHLSTFSKPHYFLVELLGGGGGGGGGKISPPLFFWGAGGGGGEQKKNFFFFNVCYKP